MTPAVLLNLHFEIPTDAADEPDVTIFYYDVICPKIKHFQIFPCSVKKQQEMRSIDNFGQYTMRKSQVVLSILLTKLKILLKTT